MVIYHDDAKKSCEASSSNQRLLTDGGQTDTDTERVDRLDELELSVHHRVETNPIQAAVEYEIHAGRADVVEIPMSLVEATLTVTGVDIRTEDVRCGAEVRFVDNPEPITDGGLDPAELDVGDVVVYEDTFDFTTVGVVTEVPPWTQQIGDKTVERDTEVKLKVGDRFPITQIVGADRIVGRIEDTEPDVARPELRDDTEIVTDGGGSQDAATQEDHDWQEYQQNEIDGAKDDIEGRLEHIAGRIQDGMLDGEMLNEHQNKRLKAYLEGYADALQYAKRQVEYIDNLVRYLDSDTDHDDPEPVTDGSDAA